ncbi:PUS3-like protein, partial [Mya arenaria]
RIPNKVISSWPAWKEGRQLDLPHELTNGHEPDLQEPMELSPLSAQYGSTNGNKENEGLDMELMSRIRQLETHVKVLQRAVKEENSVAPHMPRMAMKRKKKFRPIDFNKYTIRHVALEVMYLGHDYTGYAGTEELEHTVERELFEALIKCKLIESKESVRYSRCGRADKGVSAFGQLMEEAGKKLIGEYDFRNFSKFNVKDGITNYVRKIMEVEVKTLDETDDGFTMCELTIVARAFLWHQIRSIFSVLLVGKGKESVEVLTLDEMIASHESRKQRWRENAEIEVQDDSSEEEITSRKRYDTDQIDREYLTTNT